MINLKLTDLNELNKQAMYNLTGSFDDFDWSEPKIFKQLEDCEKQIKSLGARVEKLAAMQEISNNLQDELITEHEERVEKEGYKRLLDSDKEGNKR